VKPAGVPGPKGASGFAPLLAFALLVGMTVALRATNPPEQPPEDHDTSPYHVALLNYKSGHFDAALAAINDAEKAKPDDAPAKILKARILSELNQFDEGVKELESLSGQLEANSAFENGRLLAFGDLRLRQRHFDEATKYYELLLPGSNNDPDILLKLIYARVSVSDFVAAGKYASKLKALDPTHPDYYFAKAAIDQATGKGEPEEDIQTARTIYGVMITNRYMKTYLQVFSSSDKDISPAKRAEPPSTNAPPAAPAPADKASPQK
jgi:tetratricopeptide (TPR) repeat protein